MSLDLEIDWGGEKLAEDLEMAMASGLFVAAMALRDQIRVNLSVIGPPHSAPGEFPHMISGELRDSIKVKVHRTKLEAIIRAESPHAKFLEHGTHKMAARPFMNRTLEEMKKELFDIIVDHVQQLTGRSL